MISVIIPIYNAEKYLKSCIESVLNQTYDDFELILINDGSTDSSDLICNEYAKKDKRIKYLTKQNTGVGDTRNLGIKEAKGKWICFIDADDEVSINYLEAFNPDTSEADLILTGIEFVDINQNKILKTQSFEDLCINMRELCTKIQKIFLVGFPIGKAYKKKIFIENENIKFPTDISFHEDHVFILDVLLAINSFETKTEVTYKYKIDYTQDSLSRKKHSFDNMFKAAEYMFDRFFGLKDKFKLSHDDMKPAYTFAFSSILGGVESAYCDNIPKKKRFEMLRRAFRQEYDIRHLFFPNDKKGKLIKFVVQNNPLFIVDIFYTLLNKYHNRNR